jgi:spore coat polysaccharide biosynthesis protein SpsF (cytidylyltransferase family)
MKTVAIIQARMGSSRLPDKVLMPVLGKPLLGWMLRRISLCNEVSEIVVATTTHKRDDVIAEFVQAAGYKVYRGSEEDVLDRYYQAANNLMPDTVVRLTADCPLLDPEVLGTLIRKFQSSQVDFLSNSEPLPSSWPDGMDISIMSFKALQKAWQEAKKPSDREHVTFYFWNNPGIFKCQRIDHVPDLSNYRLTIDYLEDFLLLKAVMEHFGQPDSTKIDQVTMDAIVAYLESKPEIFAINHHYTRGLGWKPAFEQDKRLGF